MQLKISIRKLGALHQAWWMAKAIYFLKMKILFDGNKDVLKLSARQCSGIAILCKAPCALTNLL